MQQLWAGQSEVDTSLTTCDALMPCWKCTQDRTLDELAEGACKSECAIKQLATGPGSAGTIQRERGVTKDWSKANWFEKYGLVIGGGIIILIAAALASLYVLINRNDSSRDGSLSERTRLLDTPLRRDI